MSLADIITADEQDELVAQLLVLGHKRAADIIDQLVDFARDEIYMLDDLYHAGRQFLDAETVVHRLYPNTATCRSAPGIIAGQGFTRHCGVSCSNPVHAEEHKKYSEARAKLSDTLEKINEH